MNSNRFLAVLEQDGFDRATSETIVKLADEKPLDEAQELLISMLGDQNSHVSSYISNRRHAESIKQKTISRHITVNKAKPKHAKSVSHESSPAPAISNTEKVDSLKDLEAAVQKLSVSSPDRKPCDCMGSVHGLLEMAPNCLNCGRIVCNKEGLGPCIFCKEPLLPTDKIRQIVDALNEQRDAVIATMSKKALTAAGVDPSIKQNVGAMFASSAEAEANLERLLGYQANDSVRTRIIDQVGEVDLPTSGLNQWSTPSEQADQLRQQQRRLRRLELERKARLGQGRKVLSIDVRGNKIYQSVENAAVEDEDVDIDEPQQQPPMNTDPDATQATPVDPPATKYFDPASFNKLKTPRLVSKGAGSTGCAGDSPTNESRLEIHIRREAEEDLFF